MCGPQHFLPPYFFTLGGAVIITFSSASAYYKYITIQYNTKCIYCSLVMILQKAINNKPD